MPNEKEKITGSETFHKPGVCFWIPYTLLILFSLTLLYFNVFTFLRAAVVLLFIPLIFLGKGFIQKKKRVIRIPLWLILFIIVSAAFLITEPALKNRPAVSTRHPIDTNTIETQSGLLAGVYNSDKSVKVFAGIPYAAPPVGDLRWKAPQEPLKWNGIRKADHFSDSAPQNHFPAAITKLLALQLGTDELTEVVSDNEKSSEDCLYLNIWTASTETSAKLPVIVYIHGGSYKTGSGSLDIYNGENMAKKGVIFVTINYRMGIFGFLASPELTAESGYKASGNYGILDQIAALKWIKNNIRAFGGDPENVTIAGESAGSMSVNILQASPLAKGLFQRVIGESGANFGSRGIRGKAMDTLDKAEQTGTDFEASFQHSSIDDLRKLPAADLLKASKNYTMRPIVDGYVLPDTVYHIYASGKENDVPALIGYNADESTLFTALPFPFSLSPDYSIASAASFRAEVGQTYGSAAQDFLTVFPASNNTQAKISELESGTIQCFGWHVHTWARLQSQKAHSGVYTYYFDRVQPGSSSLQKLGAFHGSEIPYAYGNLKKTGIAYQSADYKLSEIMSGYWINFAATGNPNGKGLPQWDAFDPEKDRTLELNDNIHMIALPDKDKLPFFDQYESSIGSR